MRILLGAVAAALSLASPARGAKPETWELTGDATLLTDYRFRGVSQTNLTPAFQPSVTLAHRSGIYLSAWGSNIARTDGGARQEIDLTAGVAFDQGRTSVDLAATRYQYIGEDALDYYEFSASLAISSGGFRPHMTVSYVPRQSATRDEQRHKQSNYYVSAGAELDLQGSAITVVGEVGYESGYFDYAHSGGKFDWQLGIALAKEAFSLQLGFVGSTERVQHRRGNLGGPALVAQAGVAF